jgi:hypothetical protein
MTAPRTSIDHAVALLFQAIAASAQGDRMAVAVARGELVAIAAETEGFEAKLTTATVDQLVAWKTLPTASRSEIEQAIRIDVRRHVTSSIFLAGLPPWRHA